MLTKIRPKIKTPITSLTIVRLNWDQKHLIEEIRSYKMVPVRLLYHIYEQSYTHFKMYVEIIFRIKFGIVGVMSFKKSDSGQKLGMTNFSLTQG